jgi:signal peptidase I
MAGWLKYVIAFASAFALMLAVRTLVVSVHVVTGDGLAPLYTDGDCLLINRCSYGLRIEGNGLLPYCRLMRQPVERGDIVAFNIPSGSLNRHDDVSSYGLMIARCKAVPGDTIHTEGGLTIVPGLVNCAKTDYYWLEAVNDKNPVDSRYLGSVPEQNIIGRVVSVLYNRKNIRLQ